MLIQKTAFPAVASLKDGSVRGCFTRHVLQPHLSEAVVIRHLSADPPSKYLP